MALAILLLIFILSLSLSVAHSRVWHNTSQQCSSSHMGSHPVVCSSRWMALGSFATGQYECQANSLATSTFLSSKGVRFFGET